MKRLTSILLAGLLLWLPVRALAQTVSVGGVLFRDLNNNGIHEPSMGETGVDGVTLQLFRDGGNGILDGGDAFLGYADSGSGGRYVFSGLVPGEFIVLVASGSFGVGYPLNGFRSSTGNDLVPDPDNDVQGDDNGEEWSFGGSSFSGVVTRAVTVTLGSEPIDDGDNDPNTNLTVDFGFKLGPTVSVGGILFRDLNNNGVFEPGLGETGIDGVDLAIGRSFGDGIFTTGQYQGRTSSGNGGHYVFSGLVPGEFFIVVNPESFGAGYALNGFRSSTGNDPMPDPDDDVQGDDNGEEFRLGSISFSGVFSRAVTVTLGTEPINDGDNDPDTNLTVDFGFKAGPSVSLGGTVFRDLNNNGIYEPGLGETGIDGVYLQLLRDDGSGMYSLNDQHQGYAESSNGGHYLFSGLVPGDFITLVRFEMFQSEPAGRPLYGLQSSTGNDPMPDPDDDVQGDDNGEAFSLAGFPFVITHAITVTLGTEPTNDGDNDPDTNLTVDFGFASPVVFHPPIASCKDVTIFAGPSCSTTADIDDGSYDPDAGDTITMSQSPVGPYPLGDTLVTLTVTDNHGASSQCTATVTVVNPHPVVTLTGPTSGSIYTVNTPVNFAAAFTDAGGGTHTGTWMFDDLSEAAMLVEPSNATPGSATATYSFTMPGVYSVKLTITDACGGSATADQVNGLEVLVVVYDPNGGFVTGGGWINSPGGAYAANPALTGKANFGFVAKYQKGANVPTGNTEFQFKAGDLNFKSASYDWLVVAGAKARYKGSGTINGSGDYAFMLTATDGQVSGGGGVDKLRIKIWGIDAVVYDNQPGDPDTADATTALGGGSIVVHKP